MHAGTKKKTSGKIYAAEMTPQGHSTGTTADSAVHQTRGMGLPIAKQVGPARTVVVVGILTVVGYKPHIRERMVVEVSSAMMKEVNVKRGLLMQHLK